MHICKVKVENYRNFDDFDMELKPFTVIVGANNVGKSNLLNAMRLVINQDLSVSTGVKHLETADFNNEVIAEFKSKILEGEDPILPIIKVTVDLGGEMTDEQRRVLYDWFLDKERTVARITFKFEPQGAWTIKDRPKWLQDQRDYVARQKTLKSSNEKILNGIYFPIEAYRSRLYGGKFEVSALDYAMHSYLRMEVVEALRDAKKELLSESEYKLLYKVLEQRSGDNGYKPIQDHLYDIQALLDASKPLGDVKAEVEKVLDEINLSHDTGQKVGFSFISPETKEILKRVGLQYSGISSSIERNGLGRNNVLYISLILSHLGSLAAKLCKFRLISIEEPEAHLFPMLEDHLAEYLASEENSREKESGEGDKPSTLNEQVIVTSHSTHIVSRLSLSNLAVMYVNQKTGKPDTYWPLSNLDLRRKPDLITRDYLAKYLNATQSKLLFGRKLILVEGIAEQLLIPSFYKKLYGKKFIKMGYSLVNVEGLSFRHFLKIVDGKYQIDCKVITDKDEDVRAENLSSDYEGHETISVHVSSTSTFEKDIIKANAVGIYRKTILQAVADTYMNSEKKLESLETDYPDPLDEEKLYVDWVEKNKAEFALSLSRLVATDGYDLVVPAYIQSALSESIEEPDEEAVASTILA